MRTKLVSLLIVAFLSMVLGSTVTSAKEITVEKGDSLWKISREHNTTVKNLKNINNLTSDLIFPNQKLHTTPTKTITNSSEIIVKNGDSLWKISREHNITIQRLKEINGLTSDFIFPNQKLYTTSTNVTASAKVATNSTKTTVTSSQKTTSTKSSSPNVSGKELTVTATAYTANCTGCSGITATGINLKKNPNQKVIAVDPNVIPLGSKVYVEGYGTAIAGDTGGAIKGHKIDVFVPQKSTAYQWGVRKVKIKILS